MTTQSVRGINYGTTVSKYISSVREDLLIGRISPIVARWHQHLYVPKSPDYLPSRLRRISGCSALAKAIISFSSDGTEHSKPEGPRIPRCHPTTER